MAKQRYHRVHPAHWDITTVITVKPESEEGRRLIHGRIPRLNDRSRDLCTCVSVIWIVGESTPHIVTGVLVNNNDTILFQGDSITDCGREYANPLCMGTGYPMIADGMLSARFPAMSFTSINRGVSGNRTADLLARWPSDCLQLQPDVLSILIGINDVWRRYDSDSPTSVEEFTSTYSSLLSTLQSELPATKVVIIEPFILPVSKEIEAWREDLDPKICALRRISRSFNAIYIPMDGIFAAACTRRSPAFWARDGVHPSPAGHCLIALSWLSAVGAA